MKQPRKKQLTEGDITYLAEAVIVGHEVTTPDVEPLFANHFELLTMGTDIFLDIGVIDPKDMAQMVEKAQANPNESSHTVKFSVLQRVAMSPATFVLLVNKVNGTLQQIKARNASQKQNQ